MKLIRTRSGTAAIAIAGITVSIALAGCSNVAEPSESGDQGGLGTVKAAVFGTTSGDYAPYGRPYSEGVELAADYLRDQGIVDFDLVVRDTKNDSAENVAAVNDADASDIGFILSYDSSPVSLAAAPIAQRAGILFMAGSTSIDIPAVGDWIWQAPTQTQPIAATALVAQLEELGAERVAIVVDNDEYGVGTAELIRSTAEGTDIEIVDEQRLDPAASDFGPQVATLAGEDLDAIVSASVARSGGLFVRQARQAGIDAAIVGPNAWVSADFIDVAGGAAEGTYAVTDFLADPENATGIAAEFISRYQEKFGDVPVPWAGSGFDQLLMLADAMQRAGSTDPEAVRDAMADVEIDGATGLNLRFGPNRSIQKELLNVVVTDGTWVLAE